MPIKKFGKDAPKSSNIILVSRTDPPPRYIPNGSGRDLFNVSNGNLRREKELEPSGIMARKIPDKLARKNKKSREERNKITKLQMEHCTKLSDVRNKATPKVGKLPRSPKRSMVSHVSPLAFNIEPSVMKKMLKVDPKWK